MVKRWWRDGDDGEGDGEVMIRVIVKVRYSLSSTEDDSQRMVKRPCGDEVTVKVK